MFEQLMDRLDPYLTEILVGLITTYAGGFFRSMLKTKQSQENLHKAIFTGVDYVTDHPAAYLARHTSVPATIDKLPPEVVEAVISYVKGSVPDAVRYLKASDEQIGKMAKASIINRLFQIRSMI